MSAFSDDTFVGRLTELHVLDAALDAARAGHGRLVLIGGEPGIGKTRLCTELGARAERIGTRVLRGRCFESDGAPAFWPWAQALRAAVRAMEATELRAALGSGAADLAALVPAIRERLPEVVPPPSFDAGEARLRLFEAVGEFLQHAAQPSGLVLVLDDVHGADPSSLLLLDFVARALTRMPLLVLAAYRDTAVGPDHPLRAFMAESEARPDTARIDLRGLTSADLSRLVEDRIGNRPPVSLLAALHAKTEGNPLFVNEYLRMLAAQHRLSPHDLDAGRIGHVPLRVQTVIAQRLEPLSAACRTALQRAAVIGRDFQLDLLRRVSDHPAAALVEASSAAMVVPDDEAAGTYRFTHALIRETLYDTLRAPERASIHRRVAQALERQDEAAERLAELSYHFCAAGDAESLERGIDYARRAGDRAIVLLAFEEAVRLYRLALKALDRTASPPARLECTLLVRLADAEKKSGDAEAAKATALQAAAIARKQDWPELLADAALAYGSDFIEGDRPAADPIETGLLEEALDRFSGGDNQVHALLLARLARALALSSTLERCAALAQRAVEIAERVGDPRVLAQALLIRHTTYWEFHRADKRIEDADRVLALAQAVGDLNLEFQARSWRLHARLELGDAEAAGTEARHCGRLAEQLRQPIHRLHAAVLDIDPALREGRWQEAERHLQRACAIMSHVSTLFVHVLANAILGSFRGTVEPAADFLGAAVEQYPNAALRAPCAAYQAQAGRSGAARQQIEALLDHDLAAITPMNLTPALCHLATACVVLGERTHAATVYDHLKPSAALAAVVPAVELYCGPAAHYLGMLAAMLEHGDAAAEHFEQALAMNTRMRAWPWLALTEHEYARLLLARGRNGDAERARTLLDKAARSAQELDMPVLLERLHALGEPPSRTVPGRTQITAEPPPRDHPRSAVGPLFQQAGDHWVVTFDGSVLRLKDSKGIRYLARLSRQPGRALSALALATDGTRDELDDAGGAAERERARSAVAKRIKAEVKRIAAANPALGRHLLLAVSTGYDCLYEPERSPNRATPSN